MKTKATVVAIEGNTATIETERMAACDGCHKKADGEDCAVCSLMGASRKLTAIAYNKVSAKVGDSVMVETDTGRVLGYAALVFLLPLAAVILCVWIASLFTNQTVWLIGGACVGLIVSFFGIRIYSNAVKKKRYDIEITEILTEQEEKTLAEG